MTKSRRIRTQSFTPLLLLASFPPKKRVNGQKFRH
jgi:hypothetical protein